VLWVVLLCGLVLLDVALFIALVAGSNAENCESIRSDASGTDWACWELVQTVASSGPDTVIAVIAFTVLVALATGVGYGRSLKRRRNSDPSA
jgi:hypothetical protein